MKEFFDYDPFTGVTYYTEEDESDPNRILLHREMDVEPLLDHIQRQRDHLNMDAGIKKGFWKYASLPMTVCMELYRKGMNIWSQDPDNISRILKEVNTEYPKLKTTYKNHS